ncbi:class II aldolase/adducin family protein [Arenibaculum sp.]|jgi:ribulose-5-phosphate 4-epimerase/fuculose-1-phosphate aldolase|uniref:class II aldolase/adducin family protein n=1 Tax=Arenibaculum sp. TaxID=2865862 RepID=UPI002E10C8F6|nr:class II aldolase/adducin family protein [Arenibaculum sp.]
MMAGTRREDEDDEAAIRRQLAACYRLAHHFGMSDLVSTHISARAPGDGERILINAYGLLFTEITASNLIEVRLGGPPEPQGRSQVNPAGYLIHGAIHEARPDVACVMHTHTPAGVAVSAQEGGLLPVSQFALQFYDRLAYHDYEGIALLDGERRTLVEDLGDRRAMILRNHGLLTAGRTIGEAFTLMFYLQRACEAQLLAQSGGAALRLLSPDICRLTAGQHEDFGGEKVGDAEWRALMREVARIAPGYDA